MGSAHPNKHFLVVTYPAQGHINPAIHLANRLASTAPGAHITFSTAVSAHRKMFPNLASPDEELADGAISFVPFSDGFDEGFQRGADDPSEFMARLKAAGSRNLSAVIDRLGSRGQPVDCVIYTFLVSWAADVARAHGIVSAQYWIQPATVFAIYHHAFHGYGDLIASRGKDPSSTVKLPGLPALRTRELPSFVLSGADDPYSFLIEIIKEAFQRLDDDGTKRPAKVLINTFDELEGDAISSVAGDVELVAVGPILQSFPNNAKDAGFSLFKPDEKAYMEWLDSKAEKSVVYVSFGSLAVVKREQMEEMLKGLKASERPYLWVVRKDCRYEGDKLDGDNYDDGDKGMIVEWCSQMRVLSHPAVGCFVTHCGWNSTLESVVCGVPTVGIPQWTDQGTNAMLMEKVWGTGVRGEANEEGVLEGEELKRCLDLVMGEGERGKEIRKNAELWRERAGKAVEEGGSSDRNLRAFVKEIAEPDK